MVQDFYRIISLRLFAGFLALAVSLAVAPLFAAQTQSPEDEIVANMAGGRRVGLVRGFLKLLFVGPAAGAGKECETEQDRQAHR